LEIDNRTRDNSSKLLRGAPGLCSKQRDIRRRHHYWSKEMKVVRSKEFKAERAWGAMDIANMNGITTRLHWTDQPYKWHVNDGEEVFVVLDGQVQMLYRLNGKEESVLLETGDIFFASVGTEHVAHPRGEVRVLVVEHEGSV